MSAKGKGSRVQIERPKLLPGIGRPLGLSPETNTNGLLSWVYREGKGPRIILRNPATGVRFDGPEDWRLPAFSKAYLDARYARPAPAVVPVKGLTAANPASVSWLIDQFRASDKWPKKKNTANNYNSVLRRFEAKNGHAAYRDLSKADVEDMRDEIKATTPVMARRFVEVVGALYKWACDTRNADRTGKLATVNPCDGVTKPEAPEAESHHPWTKEERAQFCARFPRGTLERWAYAMVFGTGQRRSDVVRLGRQHLSKDGETLDMTVIDGSAQKKTKKEVAIPVRNNVWFPEFEAEMAAAKAAGLTGDLTYLVNPNRSNLPYTEDTFGRFFNDAAREAGLKDCTAHGLRAAAAIGAVEAGVTDYLALEGVFGFIPQIAKVYIAKHNRGTVVRNAMAKARAAAA